MTGGPAKGARSPMRHHSQETEKNIAFKVNDERDANRQEDKQESRINIERAAFIVKILKF